MKANLFACIAVAALAHTVSHAENNIELENYSSEPVRLNNLSLEVRQ